ncbi:MAG: hypothetical protein H0U37_09400 [Chloroflexi bacterium]|nr:hypothetical protein [Chloroflexota bacterium]
MTGSNAVPGFLPSVNGLHFANDWEPGPTIRLGRVDPRWAGVGDARQGLCGGMTWFVRERFEAAQPIPPDVTAPANGSPLFRTIVRRQVLSLDWMRVPLRFWRLASMDRARLTCRTLDVEWPRIRAEIDAGRPAMVGLVRHHGWNPMALDRDHQVLGFAYETDGPSGPITIRLYDPNWPDRDDVALHLTSVGFRQSTGEPLLGVVSLR